MDITGRIEGSEEAKQTKLNFFIKFYASGNTASAYSRSNLKSLKHVSPIPRQILLFRTGKRIGEGSEYVRMTIM